MINPQGEEGTIGIQRQSENPRLTNLARLFHAQTIEARYSVFQLEGRKFVKDGSQFIQQGGTYSHNNDADPVRNHLIDNYRLQIDAGLQRKKELNNLWIEAYRRGDIGFQQGVLTPLIENVKETHTRLILFGPYSLESRSLAQQGGYGGRTPLPSDSLYFQMEGIKPTAIEELISLLQLGKQSHEVYTQNMLIIRTIVSGVFPKQILDKVDSHMFREMEILNVIDKRKK